jgi:transcriptional regulator with XRE-family HTH domain
MIKVNCEYKIKEDIGFIIEAERINILELAEATRISRSTLNAIEKKGIASKEVCEKLYAYIYKRNYRINSVKEELIREKYGRVLFHGSKNGLSYITVSGSRNNCDFGNGFYLGETYSQALSFVCEYDRASVYSFKYSLEGLKCVEFDCSLDWMTAICYFRGTLKKYAESERVQKVIKKTEDADVIIAPIVDNKMFYVMSQFAEGEINADAALHSLSASRLGLQYIFKTDRALENLVPIERYYLSVPEREDCRSTLTRRGYEIDTKLKLAKREFKTGLYIEELFE